MSAADMEAHQIGLCLRAATEAMQRATEAIVDLAVAVAPLCNRHTVPLRLAERVAEELWGKEIIPEDLRRERISRIASVLGARSEHDERGSSEPEGGR